MSGCVPGFAEWGLDAKTGSNSNHLERMDVANEGFLFDQMNLMFVS
jgi:hypothetical protein